jgi:hypothetical protein
MSLGNGNPKSGDKGSNFNFELKVLQGLQTIINNGTTCCNDLSGILTNIYDRIQPLRRIPVVISTTTSGDVPFCWSFSIANVGTAAGTVNGQSLPAGATVNFDGGALNNYFESPAMSYDATGTTFLITYITD